MSKTALSTMCRRCQTHFLKTQRSLFSSSSQLRARTTPLRAPALPSNEPIEPSAELRQLAEQATNEAQSRPRVGAGPDEPYHLNVFSHKHNCHITFTEPTRDVILSYSCGNLGLKHSQRKSFDAAYQLASYTFRKMIEKSWKVGGKKTPGRPITLSDPNVHHRGIEVILRGYGHGRDAFVKAMLGSEGRMIKNLVKKVTDGTRLKFGGARSRATRRLG